MATQEKIKIVKSKNKINFVSPMVSNNVKTESSSLFSLSEAEAKNFTIVSEKKPLKDIVVADLKSGAYTLELTVLISADFLNGLKKPGVFAFVRLIKSHLRLFKGVTIKENTLYAVPEQEIADIYKQQKDEYESISNIKKKMDSLGEVSLQNENSLVDSISTDATSDFSGLCREAYNLNASDIHIMLKKDEDICEIEIRVWGSIQKLESRKMSYRKGLEMCSAAYSTMADPSSRSHQAFNTGQRQDCRIPLDLGDSERIALRYASSPSGFGANIVLRILTLNTKKKQTNDLLKMGFLESQVKMLLSIARKPIGGLLISGVTGSGKSTTMRVLMEDIKERYPGKKIISIEQPIEYEMQGIVQVNVFKENDKDTNPAAKCVKSAMRQDPDNIGVGEVRDAESAELLASAVESGHAVMATVHASSALEVPSRLSGQAMQLPLDTVASLSFISGLLYQKLVPVLCEHCKTPFDAENYAESDIDFLNRVQSVTDLNENQIYTKNENGCSHCNGTGVKGREVCAEVVIPDLKMRQFWLKGDFLGAHQHWRSTKNREDSESAQGKTSLEIAISKMNKGYVCPHDIEKAFGDINEDFIMEDGVRSYSEV